MQLKYGLFHAIVTAIVKKLCNCIGTDYEKVTSAMYMPLIQQAVQYFVSPPLLLMTSSRRFGMRSYSFL